MKKERAGQSDRAALQALGLSAADTAAAVRLTFRRGEFLFREGYPAEYFLLLVSGQVEVSISVPSGRRLLLYFYGPGAVLGIVELPLGLPATSDVEATEETVCAALPMDRCAQALDATPAFSRRLNGLLAEIVTRNSRGSALTILSSLQERLAAYILSASAQGVFSANYTRLAEILGVSGRHLFRALRLLCDEGILCRVDGGYRVADREALERLAAHCPLMAWPTQPSGGALGR